MARRSASHNDPELKLIVLDIDGVLNDHDLYENGYCGIKPHCVRAFNRILKETGAQIVVSSAWRYMVLEGSMTLEGFENLLLSHGVNCYGRIRDTTKPDVGNETRGQQILEYLDRVRCRFVILDDGDGDGWDLGITAAGLGDNFVWTDSCLGLTEADADRVISILMVKP